MYVCIRVCVCVCVCVCVYLYPHKSHQGIHSPLCQCDNSRGKAARICRSNRVAFAREGVCE
jgi:hypothetical protein